MDNHHPALYVFRLVLGTALAVFLGQMIGESEWQHLYAMNQSIYAGDKESHLQFSGKAYTPVAQRTPRIRAFQFRQEIEGIHETDMLF